MSLYKTAAIILSGIDVKDREKILTFYSRDFGKIAGILYGAKSKKGRHGLDIEPLTLITLIFQEKEGSDLVLVKDCTVIKIYKNTLKDIIKLSNALYCADLIKSLTPFRDKSIDIFELLTRTLNFIDEKENFDIYMRIFEAKLLELLGFRPQVAKCGICNGEREGILYAFSPSKGGLICSKCLKEEAEVFIKLSPSAIDFFRKVYLENAKKVERGKLDEQTSAQLRKAFLEFIKYHFDKEIKSAEFLIKLEELSKTSMQEKDNGKC